MGRSPDETKTIKELADKLDEWANRREPKLPEHIGHISFYGSLLKAFRNLPDLVLTLLRSRMPEQYDSIQKDLDDLYEKAKAVDHDRSEHGGAANILKCQAQAASARLAKKLRLVEGIIESRPEQIENSKVTTHQFTPKKRILTKNFIKNLLRALIKHLPLFGPFLYDVIYGTLDSQPSQNETNRQPKPPKSGPVFEKWYQNRTIQAALITASVLLLVSIIGWLIILYINKPKADYVEIETISSENKIPLSLMKICQDIDSRPLVQRDDTAKSYIDIRVENERLILVDAQKLGIEQDFHLTMMLPEEWSGQRVIGRHIVFSVKKEKYPELVAAKQGLEIHVSGRIEYIGVLPYIRLTDVSLSFD